MADLHETEIEGALNELEMKLDRLRALYDQFFQGYERTPPLTLRKDVVRMLNDLQRAEIRRTALRFRLQMSMQRFSQFKTLWSRTEREMDEGRFKRHRKRAESRDKQAAERGELSARDIAAIEAVRARLGEDAAIEAERKRRAALGLASTPTSSSPGARVGESTGAGTPVPAERAAAATSGGSTDSSTDAGQAAADFMASLTGGGKAAPAAPAAEAPIRGVSADELKSQAARIQFLKEKFGMSGAAAAAAAQRATGGNAAQPTASAASAAPSGDAIDKLYQRLVQTRSSLNTSAPPPDPSKFRSSVEKQAAQLREKHGYKRVDFDVVVKDGKAYIKPIPTS